MAVGLERVVASSCDVLVTQLIAETAHEGRFLEAMESTLFGTHQVGGNSRFEQGPCNLRHLVATPALLQAASA